MDYKTYYLNQAGGHYTSYVGARRQRGHGLGGIFKKLFRYVMPFIQSHAVPMIKQGVSALGAEAIKTAGNVATDMIKGSDFKNSLRTHSTEAVENLSKRAQSNLQTGSGHKNKNKRKSVSFSFGHKTKQKKKHKLRAKVKPDIFG
jgi:hypothetical protein